MLSSKTKSGSFEASHNKTSPATPRASKLGKGLTKSDVDSSSPLQNPRFSIDRSPRSVESKPAVDRRSPKVTTIPDKQPRVLKGSELQDQLGLVQEDLKKAKERLASVEKEKARALEELNEAKRLTSEANEKIGDALVAQKQAEENAELEKFRADELEQAGIEASQKREEEWQKELEAARNQHAVNVAALFSTAQELQRVKQELAMTNDAKTQALSHADDATKIAEIHAEKVGLLSVELNRLKVLLDSKLEIEANQNTELVEKLKCDVDSLKHELEKAESVEEKLVETEVLIERLRVEVDIVKKAESDAGNLVQEWQKKVEELELQVEEANQLERSTSESLASMEKQLENNNDLLQNAESEVAFLRTKVDSLEFSIGRQKRDFEESEQQLDMAKQEALEIANRVESLKIEIETVKGEKLQALYNESLAASSVKSLLEEKSKLISELEASREEEDKSKKAMESLALAVQEVSAEAREAKEKLFLSQAEIENLESQIEDLKLVLKETNGKYEAMLDESKHEIGILAITIEQSNHEFENTKIEWEQKELNLVNCIKQSEEETSSIKREMDRLVNLLGETEEEAQVAKEEGAQILSTLKQAESKLSSLEEVLEEAKGENVKLKERLLDRENELQNIVQENEEIRLREAAALQKVEELTKLLEEASSKTKKEENVELSGSEKDYDLLPKVVEFTEENGGGIIEEKHKPELPSNQLEVPQGNEGKSKEKELPMGHEVENGIRNSKEEEKKEEVHDSVNVEAKMWETCKIEEKDLLPEGEHEPESFEEEHDLKIGGEGFDQVIGLPSSENMDNGGSSPSKQQSEKKKNPLLRKFGSLLKKKGSNNHK